MDILIKFLYYFTMSFAIMSSVIFCWHRLLNEKINFKNKRLYITLFCLMIISLLNYFGVNAFLRTSIITIFLIIFFKYLFKTNIKTSIITPVFVQILYMISETIFVVAICIILDMGAVEVINTQFGKLLSNVIISILSMFFINIPIIHKIYKLLLKFTIKINQTFIILFSILLIIIANLLGLTLYFEIKFRYLLVFNTILSLICFAIVMYVFKTKDNFIKIKDKYNTTLNSLKEYEEILDRYRVSNHENKNQLLTIKGMIADKEQEVIKYIDTIVENKLKYNEKTMLEVSKIPTGGLRGLIYSKIAYIKDAKIDYELELSNDLRTVDLINKISDDTMLDICKIIGVYLDNAIQEVEKNKEKYINIEMYIEDNNFIISITNTYEGKINLDKIESIGYTTKGQSHGYGLPLTREIIEKNKLLSNEKVITKETFTQVLKIKM